MNVLLISLQEKLDVMGLKCLHQYLLAHGKSSTLLYLPEFDADAQGCTDEIRRFAGALKPGLIGVSLMSIEYKQAAALTRFLKGCFPDIPVVWGGIHPTTDPESCLDVADYVCLGEGEGTLLAMVEALEQGGGISSAPNLCFRVDGQMQKNDRLPLIQDLDSLPALQRIPAESYVQGRWDIRPVDNSAFKRHMRYGTRVYNIISSRGCPFRCSYCNNSSLHKLYPGWGVRRRSVEKVIAELEQAVEECPGIEYVNMQDDCFLACEMGYLQEFTQKFKARVNRRLIAKSTPTYVTKERMILLKEAGLAWFNMGLQSGSDRVCQEVYNRKSLPEHFLKAAGILHDLRIAIWYDVIVDNPFETDEDRFRTIETLMRVPKPSYPQLFSLVFYSGTALRDRAATECPDLIGNPTENNFYVYHKSTLNDLIETATALHAPMMRALLEMYRKSPGSSRTGVLIWLAKMYARVVLRPIMYFRVIVLAHNGSLLKTFQVLPNYLKVGLGVYFGLFFSAWKRH
jgi:radical SAM superfamily enzyme YgiQ (UPF0313 family)